MGGEVSQWNSTVEMKRKRWRDVQLDEERDQITEDNLNDQGSGEMKVRTRTGKEEAGTLTARFAP